MFTWAGHVIRRVDGRWSTTMLNWTPGTEAALARRQAHPRKRWEDALDAFFVSKVGVEQGEWKLFAADRAEWHTYEKEFVEHAV